LLPLLLPPPLLLLPPPPPPLLSSGQRSPLSLGACRSTGVPAPLLLLLDVASSLWSLCVCDASVLVLCEDVPEAEDLDASQFLKRINVSALYGKVISRLVVSWKPDSITRVRCGLRQM
jgi:hypothetical protein